MAGAGREKKPHFSKDSVWPAHVSEGEVKCISAESLLPAPQPHSGGVGGHPNLPVRAGRVRHSGVVAPVALSKFKKKKKSHRFLGSYKTTSSISTHPHIYSEGKEKKKSM